MHLLYLTIIFIKLQCWTVYLIYEKWTLDYEELVKNYKESFTEKYSEDLAEEELKELKE